MTIQGAIAELQNLLGADDIPLYYKPAIEKVIETIVDELPSADRPSEGLIKRSDAIEAIEIIDWYHQNSNKDMVHGANDDEHQAWYKADDVYKALEAVPSADRPRGYWIGDKCSVCGEERAWYGSNPPICPDCGADMRPTERSEE